MMIEHNMVEVKFSGGSIDEEKGEIDVQIGFQ